MGSTVDFARNLVVQEIRRVMARQAGRGAVLRTSSVARAVRRAYPITSLTARELEDLIFLEAAEIGAPVEIVGKSQRKRDMATRSTESRPL